MYRSFYLHIFYRSIDIDFPTLIVIAITGSFEKIPGLINFSQF